MPGGFDPGSTRSSQVATALERRQLLQERRDYTRNLEERVRQQTVVIRRAQEETIHRLISASLWRDEETGMHIRRTGLFSEALAKAGEEVFIFFLAGTETLLA